MELPDRGQAKSWEGCEVLDVDGEALGTCVAVFADADTGVTEWLQVDVTGLGRSFVPALDAADVDGKVRVRFTAVAVRGAPRVDRDQELSQAQERSLYDHYGVPVSTQETDSVLPADADVSDGEPTPDGAESTAAPGRPPLAPVAPSPTSASTTSPPDVEPVPEVEQVLATDREPVLTDRPEPELALEVPQGAGTAAALAPLAGIAALAAVVWGILRALEARSRRNRPTARAARRASVLQGSASALAGRSARQLSETASSTSRAAAKTGKQASRNAATRRKEAAKVAGKRKKETTKAAAKGRRQTVSAVSQAADTASRRGQAVASGTAAAPRRAAKKARRAKRTVARNLWQALLVAVGGAGYVLGAKAGEERYEQIEQQAAQLTSRPEVQQVLEKVRGPVS
jgi:hypothetical protein